METETSKIHTETNGAMLGDFNIASQIETSLQSSGNKRSAEDSPAIDATKRAKSDELKENMKSPTKQEPVPQEPVAFSNSIPVEANTPPADTPMTEASITRNDVIPPSFAQPIVAPAQSAAQTVIHPHPISVTNYGTFVDTEDDDLNRSQLKFAGSVLKSLKRAKEAYLFSTPVDPIRLNIPQYFDIIKRPMG